MAERSQRCLGCDNLKLTMFAGDGALWLDPDCRKNWVVTRNSIERGNECVAFTKAGWLKEIWHAYLHRFTPGKTVKLDGESA